MAEDERCETFATRIQKFDRQQFWRLGLWGMSAVVAVLLAAIFSNSELGRHRIAVVYSAIHDLTASTQSRDNGAMQHLSEGLRTLIDDRDRLFARLDTIERNLDDLTGSIGRSNVPARAAESIQPTPAESTVETVPAASSVTTIFSPPAPAQQPPANSSTQDATPVDIPVTIKPEFGVDLGSAPTMEGLRTLWMSAKGRHAALLEGLRPIIAVREHARPGSMELRLVVGPLPSAALAARLCIVITATGAVCHPTVFDGQRLALR